MPLELARERSGLSSTQPHRSRAATHDFQRPSMYSYMLFKSRLVPRPLATLGLTGAALVTVAALLAMFDIARPFTAVSGLLAAPIGVYEMILAGWLQEPTRRLVSEDARHPAEVDQGP